VGCVGLPHQCDVQRLRDGLAWPWAVPVRGGASCGGAARQSASRRTFPMVGPWSRRSGAPPPLPRGLKVSAASAHLATGRLHLCPSSHARASRPRLGGDAGVATKCAVAPSMQAQEGSQRAHCPRATGTEFRSQKSGVKSQSQKSKSGVRSHKPRVDHEPPRFFSQATSRSRASADEPLEEEVDSKEPDQTGEVASAASAALCGRCGRWAGGDCGVG